MKLAHTHFSKSKINQKFKTMSAYFRTKNIALSYWIVNSYVTNPTGVTVFQYLFTHLSPVISNLRHFWLNRGPFKFRVAVMRYFEMMFFADRYIISYSVICLVLIFMMYCFKNLLTIRTSFLFPFPLFQCLLKTVFLHIQFSCFFVSHYTSWIEAKIPNIWTRCLQTVDFHNSIVVYPNTAICIWDKL